MARKAQNRERAAPGAELRNRGERWYGEGLRFQCRRCNACCGGAPGYVWVDRDDVARMAEYLGMSPRAFSSIYCRRVWWRTSLRERGNGDCILLTEDGCAAYAVRPPQCRAWPFWPDNVDTPEHWAETRSRCPGAASGKLYSAEQIDRIGRGEVDASRD